MKLLPLALVSVAAVGGLKYASERAVRRYEHLDLHDLASHGKHVEVDGVEMHYEEMGAGDPVVLIHGLGASTYCYRFLLPALADSHRAIALDLPGFGFSSREAGDMSHEAMVRYLAAFLDALGIEKAAFVGHSMGGSIVQRFAVAFPERVQALVLVSPATNGQLRRAWFMSPIAAPWVSLFAWLLYYNPRMRRRWLRLAVHDPAFLTPELMVRYSFPTRIRGNSGGLRRWLMGRARDRPFDPSSIHAPTLIVWGKSDRLLPPTGGLRLIRQIEASRLEVVPEAGHLVLEEKPEAVNRLVTDFLRSLDVAGEAARSTERSGQA